MTSPSHFNASAGGAMRRRSAGWSATMRTTAFEELRAVTGDQDAIGIDRNPGGWDGALQKPLNVADCPYLQGLRQATPKHADDFFSGLRFQVSVALTFFDIPKQVFVVARRTRSYHGPSNQNWFGLRGNRRGRLRLQGIRFCFRPGRGNFRNRAFDRSLRRFRGAMRGFPSGVTRNENDSANEPRQAEQNADGTQRQ